jgi:hypothetical protein
MGYKYRKYLLKQTLKLFQLLPHKGIYIILGKLCLPLSNYLYPFALTLPSPMIFTSM